MIFFQHLVWARLTRIKQSESLLENMEILIHAEHNIFPKLQLIALGTIQGLAREL